MVNRFDIYQDLFIKAFVTEKTFRNYAKELGRDVKDIKRIFDRREAIDDELWERVKALYELKLGIKLEGVKPPVPEIKKGSAITRLTGLEDKNTMYEAENTRDVLPYYVELKNYDPDPINRIGNFLEDWSVNFFRKKDKAMKLVKAKELSISTHYGNEVPDSRRLEFELIDIETGELRYGFIYTKGKIIWSLGNLPLSEIVAILKDIGAWEQ